MSQFIIPSLLAIFKLRRNKKMSNRINYHFLNPFLSFMAHSEKIGGIKNITINT